MSSTFQAARRRLVLVHSLAKSNIRKTRRKASSLVPNRLRCLYGVAHSTSNSNGNQLKRKYCAFLWFNLLLSEHSLILCLFHLAFAINSGAEKIVAALEDTIKEGNDEVKGTVVKEAEASRNLAVTHHDNLNNKLDDMKDDIKDDIKEMEERMVERVAVVVVDSLKKSMAGRPKWTDGQLDSLPRCSLPITQVSVTETSASSAALTSGSSNTTETPAYKAMELENKDLRERITSYTLHEREKTFRNSKPVETDMSARIKIARERHVEDREKGREANDKKKGWGLSR